MPTRKQPTDEEMKAKALSRWENEGGAPAPKPRKRPRDPNQLAKRIVDIATGEAENNCPTTGDSEKDPAAVSLGRRGGLKGGEARAKALSPKRRSEIARKAATARWESKTPTR